MPSLKLGDTRNLQATDPILAFGFPFGKAIAVNDGSNPSISVNIGRVTSLRRADGELRLIQTDAQINPGNSGGPVIDEDGKVIGVVLAGIKNSGVHFVIPIERVHRVLDEPIVTFRIPEKAAKLDITKPREFEVEVTPAPWMEDLEYNVTMTIGRKAAQRTLKLDRAANNTYTVTAPLVKRKEGATVMVEATLEGESVTFAVPNTTRIMVKDEEIPLTAVETLTRQPNGIYIVRRRGQSRRIVGKLTNFALSDIQVTLPDGTTKKMDLTKARRLVFPPQETPEEVLIAVSVTAPNGAQVGALRRAVAITDTKVAVRDNVDFPGGRIEGLDLPEPEDRLKEPKKLKLPAAIEDVCYGAAGRYMICRLANRQLAVVDLGTGQVAGYISLASSNVAIAGGQRDVVVVIRDKAIAMRYSLMTFRKTLTKKLDVKGEVRGIAMGHASKGPLAVASGLDRYNGSVKFFTLNSLKPAKLTGGTSSNLRHRNGTFMRASANGELFCMHGAAMLQIEKDRIISRSQNRQELELPSPDGLFVHGSSGTYAVPGSRLVTGITLPAVHGSFFMRVQGYSRNQIKRDAKVSLHVQGNSDPIGDLSKTFQLFNTARAVVGSRATLKLDQRIAFAPGLGMIAVVHSDFVQLWPFDLLDVFKESDKNYLVVVSDAPPRAKVGTTYTYPIKVLSKAGNVQLNLDGGPDNLKMDKQGVIRWKPKREHKGETESVIVTITDASKKELLYTFQIRCE